MSIDTEKQRLIDEASDHPYECTCDTCKLWWESMPPDEDEDMDLSCPICNGSGFVDPLTSPEFCASVTECPECEGTGEI